MALLEGLQIDSGPVIGFRNTSSFHDEPCTNSEDNQTAINTWLAIPYAQAGRFEHSKKPDPWTEPFIATRFGPRFYQADSPSEKSLSNIEGWHTRTVSNSQNAFHINVFSTSDQTPKKSVCVWIYGGSLISGYAERPLYDPTELLRRHQELAQPGAIVVTFNYRTNIFGWLAHPDMKDADGLAGNYGLRDCLTALQWVQRNISAFGGDPDNVTVFGESAGAWISNVLFCASEKLFKRAYLSSGAVSAIACTSLETACPWYDKLLEDYDLLHLEPSARAAALRKIPAEDLFASGLKYTTMGIWHLAEEQGPKAIWAHSPVYSLMQGEYHPAIEEVVIGLNRDEGTMIAMGLHLQKPENLRAFIEKRYPEVMHEEIERLYSVSQATEKDSLLNCAGSHISADSIFISSFMHTARTLSGVPNSQTKRLMSVYAYRLDTVAEVLQKHPSVGNAGVMHTLDLPYLFNFNSIWELNSIDAATSASIGEDFLTFAREGQVQGWPRFTPQSPSARIYGTRGTTHIEDLSNFRKEECDLWFQLIEAKATPR